MQYLRNRVGIPFVLATAASIIAALGIEAMAPAGKESKANPHVPMKELRELDSQVLAAVLDNLMSDAGADSPVLEQGHLPHSLWFSPVPIATDQTLENLLYEHDLDRWERLTESQRAAAREAAKELLKRIGTVEVFNQVHPEDKRIRVATKREVSNSEAGASERFKRPLRAWAPGYSPDHTFAMVRLVIPWSMHHAEGTYLLVRAEQRWAIVLRQFVYYP